MNRVSTEEAVKRLILAAAPEREEDFLSIWDQYSPQIEFIEDKEGFSLEAGAFKLVLFNHKSMAQIWLLGFAAQYAFQAFLPYLRLSQILNLPITVSYPKHAQYWRDFEHFGHLLVKTAAQLLGGSTRATTSRN